MDELNRSLDTIEEEIIPTDQNEIIENIAKNYKVPITNRRVKIYIQTCIPHSLLDI